MKSHSSLLAAAMIPMLWMQRWVCPSHPPTVVEGSKPDLRLHGGHPSRKLLMLSTKLSVPVSYRPAMMLVGAAGAGVATGLLVPGPKTQVDLFLAAAGLSLLAGISSLWSP